MLPLEHRLTLVGTWFIPLTIFALALWALSKARRGFLIRRVDGGRHLTLGLRIVAVALAAGFTWGICALFDAPLPATKFADGYSKHRFGKIGVGDSRDFVESILGEPLLVTDSVGNQVILWYALPKRGMRKSHWTRSIVVEAQTQNVVEIYSGLYVDL